MGSARSFEDASRAALEQYRIGWIAPRCRPDESARIFKLERIRQVRKRLTQTASRAGIHI